MSDSPERKEILPLLSSETRQRLAEYERRSVSGASQISQISTNSGVQSFFDEKITCLENELAYNRCLMEGLTNAKIQGLVSEEQFRDELRRHLASFCKDHQKFRVLKRQHELVEEDLEDSLSCHMPQDGDLDREILERAYRDTILPRNMAASAKQQGNRRRKAKHSNFRHHVHQYYGVGTDKTDLSHCHILNMELDRGFIKAAHIVPKCLNPEEVANIFGQDEIDTMDPRNGLLLHRTLELALDHGDIVIFPLAGGGEHANPTRWRCVLINEDRKKDIVWQGWYKGTAKQFVRFEDIDNKELTFKNNNRLRRRFLYFRFLVSYLWAKRLHPELTLKKVDATHSWPTMGRYLRKSTLRVLARCISGSELPSTFTDDNTFESPGDEENECTGYTMSKDLEDANIYNSTADSVDESSVQGDEEDDEEDNKNNENDDF